MNLNLDNLPTQLFGLACGWAFTLYLQHRANHRTEALKRKDKLVEKIDALPEWLDKKISDEDFDALSVEDAFSGLLSRIEIKAGQLNNHVGEKLVCIEKIAELRQLDLSIIPTSSETDSFDEEMIKQAKLALNSQVRTISSDLADAIEQVCDTYFFKSRKRIAIKAFKLLTIVAIAALFVS
ncbi:hypothetical protein I5L56_15270 [Pseudomonas oryzihabitans]|uniref:hypothetical protein n=1 Tax=Pseudomonas oryzihabitans TaxID=47885 RepID=UPI0018D87775|nr:hypothetical protein [Pseudomonas oryzihabitans]MBH3330993.1 hypothetical protein [Pseudomonas oryzihabitans]